MVYEVGQLYYQIETSYAPIYPLPTCPLISRILSTNRTLLDRRVTEEKLEVKFEGSYVTTEDLRREKMLDWLLGSLQLFADHYVH
jgi:hypothetical protein